MSLPFKQRTVTKADTHVVNGFHCVAILLLYCGDMVCVVGEDVSFGDVLDDIRQVNAKKCPRDECGAWKLERFQRRRFVCVCVRVCVAWRGVVVG